MFHRRKQSSLFFFAILVIIGVAYFFYNYEYKNIRESYERTSMVLYSDLYDLSVADTPKKRDQGLSGKEKLLPNTGMFFKFDELGQQGIWMKDMNFAIDILWLDEKCKVVAFKSATPESFPETFTPKTEALYVVEVPVNSISDKVQIGDQFTCPKI